MKKALFEGFFALLTEQTGESPFRVECYVERDTGREPYLVSTVKLDSSVQVVFESAEAEE